MANLIEQPDGTWAIRDPHTGELLVVRGAYAMKDSPLHLRKEIDLTKPIAEQVYRLWDKEKRQAKRKR